MKKVLQKFINRYNIVINRLKIITHSNKTIKFKAPKKYCTIKEYLKKHHKTISIWIIAIWLFITIMFIQQYFNSAKYCELNNKYITLSNKLKQTEAQLTYETTQRRVEITMIKEKVNLLYDFLKKHYPTFDYDYKNTVNIALENSNEITSLPEDLFAIYIKERFIKPHGLSNYEKTLKNLAWPLEENSAFVSEKDCEYGQYRPYSYSSYDHVHEGMDIFTYYNNSVYAVYDAEIYRKYYDEGGGWSVTIKFKYTTTEGQTKYCLVIYRHLQEVYVNEGDVVKRGQVIANMGKTGNFATGIHLHFSLYIWNGEKYINYNPVQNSTYNNKVIRTL